MAMVIFLSKYKISSIVEMNKLFLKIYGEQRDSCFQQIVYLGGIIELKRLF
jgi:hypothetical protein